MKRVVLAVFLVLLLSSICAAQEKPSAPPAAKVPSAVVIDDELQELLLDRNVLAALIAFSEKAKGDVHLRFSLEELHKIDDAKVRRIAAWFDKHSVPQDWQAKGWKVEDGKFIPPTDKK